MNVTNRAETVDEKMWPFVQLPRFLPELRSLNCCNFVLISAKNLSLLVHLHMHLKGFLTHFQKTVLFIILWRSV